MKPAAWTGTLFAMRLPGLTAWLLAALLGAPQDAGAEPAGEVGGIALGDFPVGARPSVRLLEPGQEPRRSLRYRFETVSTHRMVATLSLLRTVSAGGRIVERLDQPRYRTLVDIRILESNTEQSRYSMIVPTPPELVDAGSYTRSVRVAMREELRGLTHVRGHTTITSRGLATGRLEPIRNASPQLERLIGWLLLSLRQIAVPLPEQPVGVGARWQVLRRLQVEPSGSFQVVTYELRELEGSTAALELQLEELTPRALGSSPVRGRTRYLEPLDTRTEGHGSVSLDLSSPVPHSTLDQQSVTAVRVHSDGRVFDGVTQEEASLKVEPRSRR